jgi:hypothetical protein
MKRVYLLVTIVILVAIPVFTAIKIPCPQTVACEVQSGEEVKILSLKAEYNGAHCKGLEYNVSVTLHNSADKPQDIFVHIDGWDLDINMHVTEGDLPVHLDPGETKTVSAMLPIDSQSPKPSYYFNATIVSKTGTTSSNLGRCSCRSGEQIPLYKYLLITVSGA